MRYALLLHYSEESADTIGQEALDQGKKEMASYAATLHAAGVLVSAEVLRQTDTSTTLRYADGGLRVQDGPFADTKEQLGGTIVIDVPDLDAALKWAEQAPVLGWMGAVEVRPSASYTVAGRWTPGN